MLDGKKILGNFSVAVLAQGIVLVSSVLSTLLVPKVLGVEEFGYWQLFLFYGSYTGFFHLGLNDGVYLVNGGISRADIDKRSINSQFAVGVAYQTAFSVVMCVIALVLAPGPQRMFVLFMTGVYLVVTNAGGFIGYVLQAMDETRLYSAYSAISSALFLVPLVVMLFLKVDAFQPYVLFYTLARAVGLAACLWWMRDFFSAGLLRLGDALRQTFDSIRVGVKLMIANIASMLILGVSRFVIDYQWGIEVFSVVSFALSMVSFFLIFAAQASMVLFPALRKAEAGESASFFLATQQALDLFLPVCYVLYFPAVALLNLWLPQYAESLVYFAYLLPVAVFNGKMDLLGNTYLMVLRREDMLLWVNVATVAFSAVGALVGGFLVHSIELMLFFAVLAIVLREVYVERRVQRMLQVKGSPKAFWGAIVVTVAFLVVCVAVPSKWVAFAAVCAAYAVFLLLNRKSVSESLSQLRNVIA